MLLRRGGSIRFRGAETITPSPNRIARLGIAWCPEERGIFASLTVRNNLTVPPLVAPGVIGLCNAGGDFLNSVKQASEFGITRRGQKLADMLVFITDVHGLGLEKAQRLTLTTAFYHGRNKQSRAFTGRFRPCNFGIRLTMAHTRVYGGVCTP